MSLDNPVVEIKALRKSYGATEVLKGVSLSVSKGEVVVMFYDHAIVHEHHTIGHIARDRYTLFLPSRQLGGIHLRLGLRINF